MPLLPALPSAPFAVAPAAGSRCGENPAVNGRNGAKIFACFSRSTAGFSRQRGFTLIELLVVVAILSAASLLAFGAFSEDRSQIRHEDSRQRLLVLRRAILGQSSGDFAAGFVADNGALPTDLATLLQAGTLASRAGKAPVFDPKPNESCENDGSGEITLSDAAAQLVKGHRGDYLGGLAVNGRFRDGWGNVASSDDALNFGWQTLYNSSDKSLSITSLGLDNAVGGSDYASDTSQGMVAADWLLPLDGWTVTVKNLLNTDFRADELSLSLLVFVNDTAGGKWRRYASTSLNACLDAASGSNSDGTCPDSSGSSIPGTSSATASFIDGCKPGTPVAGLGRIPQGRHLLVLTHNGADRQPWTADDTVSWGSSPVRGPYVMQIDAVAGRNLPLVTLEIR